MEIKDIVTGQKVMYISKLSNSAEGRVRKIIDIKFGGETRVYLDGLIGYYTLGFLMRNFEVAGTLDGREEWLYPKYFIRQSYDQKAKVHININGEKKILMSYGVHVAGIVKGRPYVRPLIMLSRTTATHIADFFMQNGIPVSTPSMIRILMGKYRREIEKVR